MNTLAPLRRALRASLALCALALCLPAQAQTPSPMAEWQYSAGVALMPRFVEQPPEWQVNLGFGTGLTPRYEGSDQSTWQTGPLFTAMYRDLAFFSLGEGLGVNFVANKTGRAGVAIAYDRGRREIDFPPLRGLGNINPAPELKAFGELVLFPVVLRADARRALGGHGGWIGDLSAYMPVAGSKTFFVFVGPSATFADGTYMQNYFGITPQQSTNSDAGYAPYAAGGGLKSAQFGSNVTWFFTDNWFLQGVFAAQRFYGDAADSPIVRQREQYTGSVYVAYSF